MSDVIVVSERRRSWPDEVKQQILAEADAPGESVLSIARRHELEPAQIYQWRKKFRDTASVDSDIRMVPVEITESAAPASSESFTPTPADTRLEIACKNGRHLFVPLDIDEKKLVRLVSALEKA